MEKIPTIFKRNPDIMSFVLEEENPECKWVFDGEGVATRKYDGTCVKIEGGCYFKRRMVKPGKKAPEDFEEVDVDPVTGKRFGWVPIDSSLKENKYHMEAFNSRLSDGTYELVGPKVQGNPEGYEGHELVKHSDAEVFPSFERTFAGIRDFLLYMDVEGIVFHHPDGRMAKIKKCDFGLPRVYVRRYDA